MEAGCFYRLSNAVSNSAVDIKAVTIFRMQGDTVWEISNEGLGQTSAKYSRLRRVFYVYASNIHHVLFNIEMSRDVKYQRGLCLLARNKSTVHPLCKAHQVQLEMSLLNHLRL